MVAIGAGTTTMGLPCVAPGGTLVDELPCVGIVVAAIVVF